MFVYFQPLSPFQILFQKKIDEFNDIPNVFGTANDFLIAGFDADGWDHDVKLEQSAVKMHTG